MKTRGRLGLGLAMMLVAGAAASAQTGSLTTTFQGGNSQAGAMFDLTAINQITITGFDYLSSSSAAPTMQEIEIYAVTDRTTFEGKEQDPSQWTLIERVMVERQPSPATTHVPISGFTIEPGETIGFYFTRSAGGATTSISYTNGPLGAFSNADLIFEDRGLGVAYPFGTNFSVRVWNGTIHYNLGATVETGACCFPDGSCDEVPEALCVVNGGTYHGNNTECATTPPGGCPQPPTGACCLDGGGCTVVWEPGCIAQGGLYQGDGTECGTVTCPLTLTTTYDGTVNASGTGAGAYFDVTALDPQGIVVDGFHINSPAAAGTPLTVHVYVTPNTHVGVETDPLAWTLLGEAQTTAAGVGERTPVNIGGLHIAQNERWGFRVGTTSSGGVRYSSAATMLPVHANSEVQINLGTVQTGLFAGTLFDPRGWNGTLFYSVGATVTTGACCLPDGSCQEVREAICTGQGGTYHGDNTDCATTPPGGCPQPPTGACCLADGSCNLLNSFQCADVEGRYQGDNTTCVGLTCPVIIIDNMPGNDGSQSASLEGGRIKAMGFSMPAGDDFELGEVDLRLSASTTEVVPLVRLYDDLGGAPGNLLVTFDSPPVTMTGSQTMTFTPLQPYTLLPMTNYWLVVWNSGSGSMGWLASSPAQMPTGVATHYGSLFATNTGPNPPLATNTSSIINTYAVFGDSSDPLCYANCDGSTTEPILTVDDFTCFINEFAQAQTLPVSQQITHYANCDGSTTEPVLTVDDFTCFINAFAQGCP